MSPGLHQPGGRFVAGSRSGGTGGVPGPLSGVSRVPLALPICCRGRTVLPAPAMSSALPSAQEEPLDESSVKKMILTFEKRSYKNQELRIKFPDNPEK